MFVLVSLKNKLVHNQNDVNKVTWCSVMKFPFYFIEYSNYYYINIQILLVMYLIVLNNMIKFIPNNNYY